MNDATSFYDNTSPELYNVLTHAPIIALYIVTLIVASLIAVSFLRYFRRQGYLKGSPILLGTSLAAFFVPLTGFTSYAIFRIVTADPEPPSSPGKEALTLLRDAPNNGDSSLDTMTLAIFILAISSLTTALMRK